MKFMLLIGFAPDEKPKIENTQGMCLQAFIVLDAVSL